MHNYMLLFGILTSLVTLMPALLFRSKTTGLFVMSGILLVMHLALALITQFAHIFEYDVLAVIGGMVAIGSVIVTLRALGLKNGRQAEVVKDKGAAKAIHSFLGLHWMAIAALLIIFLELYSVHYDYTGKITTVNGSEKVIHAELPYPYYSDEWVGASLASRSIETKSLPVMNSLIENEPFPNFLIPYFSLTAELFLYFGLNPVTGYPIFALVSGMLLCAVFYLFMRRNGIHQFAAVFVVLLMPLIVNGANLPALWYFIPFSLSCLMFFSALCMLSSPDTESALEIENNNETGSEREDRKLRLFFAGSYAILAMAFYPPIFVFIAPVLVPLYFTSRKEPAQRKRVAIIAGVAAAMGIIAILLLALSRAYTLGRALAFFFSFLIRPNLTFGFVPDYSIWKVIPVFAIPFAFHGLYLIFSRKRWLFVLTVFGLVTWAIYPLFSVVVLIEYSRIVMMTSFLLILLSGFSFDFILKKILASIAPLDKKYHFHPLTAAGIVLLAFFFFNSMSYTSNDSWKNLTLTIDGVARQPASPANRYLTPEDLSLFSGIHKSRFIAQPWKGLVIAAVTGNYPMESKPSTLTNKKVLYADFMEATCDEKKKLVDQYRVKYVYSAEFSCDGYEKIGESSEGFVLYKVSK